MFSLSLTFLLISLSLAYSSNKYDITKNYSKKFLNKFFQMQIFSFEIELNFN